MEIIYRQEKPIAAEIDNLSASNVDMACKDTAESIALRS
jgi:hypothetical protein